MPASLRVLLFAFPLSIALLVSVGDEARAVIAGQGDVSDSLAPGGDDVADIVIGDTAYGLVTIDGGTDLTGDSGILGEEETGVGELTLDGIGSLWSLSEEVTVGSDGAGRISATGGSRLETDGARLGFAADGSGQIALEGFGTTWSNTDPLLVGRSGQGLLALDSGARAFVTSTVVGDLSGGVGSIAVAGHQSLLRGSSTMIVGDAGAGRLDVGAGGRVENTAGTIGNTVGASGVVLVDGAGSAWSNTSLRIGVDGLARMEITAGGRVSNSSSSAALNIADADTSEAYVKVAGADSMWSSAADVNVAREGVATVEVLDGGRIESGDVVIGDLADSYGTIVVDGQNSVWEITGQLDVGDVGYGEAIVANNGVVTVSSGSISAFEIGVRGQLTLAGGRLIALNNAAKLANNGILQGSGVIDTDVASTANAEMRTATGDRLQITGDLTNAGLVDQRGGTLEVDGSIVNTGPMALKDSAAVRVTRLDGPTNSLQNNAGGQLAATGGAVDIYATVANAANAEIVVGGESVATFHDAVTNNGELFVMPGSRALMLADLTFGASSTTTLVLASTADDAGGPQIEVGGAAALAGALHVLIDDNYQPAAGDAFKLLTAAGGITGGFAAPTLPGLATGLAWALDTTPDSLMLSVVADSPADFNGDGKVNADDLDAWQSGFGLGPGATANQGDANGDGFVNSGDFLAWQRAFVPGSVAVGVPTPEPGALTAALLLGGTLLLARRRLAAPESRLSSVF